jgi:hypothetical protein
MALIRAVLIKMAPIWTVLTKEAQISLSHFNKSGSN